MHTMEVTTALSEELAFSVADFISMRNIYSVKQQVRIDTAFTAVPRSLFRLAD